MGDLPSWQIISYGTSFFYKLRSHHDSLPEKTSKKLPDRPDQLGTTNFFVSCDKLHTQTKRCDDHYFNASQSSNPTGSNGFL